MKTISETEIYIIQKALASFKYNGATSELLMKTKRTMDSIIEKLQHLDIEPFTCDCNCNCMCESNYEAYGKTYYTVESDTFSQEENNLIQKSLEQFKVQVSLVSWE